MDKLIATIRKNAVDEVRVALTEFKGYSYVDVRLFTELEDKPEKAPTKKGITPRPDLLPELLAALQKAEAEARAAGLLR
ncbi:MAG: transcriptional coactivator p15/PC4 family protein [Gammaproteobacteria bacterium]